MSLPGRKRRITAEQVKRIREWMPFAELCQRLGVRRRMARAIRSGYQFKQPSP